MLSVIIFFRVTFLPALPIEVRAEHARQALFQARTFHLIVHVYRLTFRFLGLPWTALNLGLLLQITKSLPLLFTTWQSGCLFFADFKEFTTFMCFP